jgi:hypothetical protein
VFLPSGRILKKVRKYLNFDTTFGISVSDVFVLFDLHRVAQDFNSFFIITEPVVWPRLFADKFVSLNTFFISYKKIFYLQESIVWLANSKSSFSDTNVFNKTKIGDLMSDSVSIETLR